MLLRSAALSRFGLIVAIVFMSVLSVGKIGPGVSLHAQENSADLRVQLFAFPDPVPTSSDLTYLVVLSNFGDDEATNVVLTDTLPAGTVFKSADDPCTFDGTSTVTCTFSTLGVTFDEGVPLQITVTTPSTASTLVNNVSVTSDASDPDESNNSASVSTAMQAFDVSDLSVSSSATPNPGIIRRPLTFRTTVTNLGPHDAAGVTLRDFTSFGADVFAITPSQGSCQLVGDEIDCDLGSLAADATATLDVSATPLVAGPAFNIAFVNGYGDSLFLDPDSSNDSTVFSVNVKTPGKSNPAQTTMSNQDIPISQTVFNTCTGEYVALEGTVHSVMHSTANGNHYDLHVLTNGRDLTGIGMTSGDAYAGANITRSTFSQPRTGSPVTQSFGETLDLTDSVTGAVLHLHANMRVTIDANGVPSVLVDNLTFSCN